MNTYIDSPYINIPNELLKDYTMDGKIPILNLWVDETKDSVNNINWTKEYMDNMLSNFTHDKINNNLQGWEPYEKASLRILKAVEKYKIENKKVAVVGTLIPWIEAILLNNNNYVTTVEYNVPAVNYNNLI